MNRAAIFLAQLFLGISVVILSVHVRPAAALELTWANGAKNLAVTSTSACTLMVRSSIAGDALPGQWKLVYSGECDVAGDSALVILNASGPAEAAPVCAVRGPATPSEAASHESTVEFCGPGDGQGTAVAAFVLRIDASLHARIAAVPILDMLASSPSPIGPDAEVSVNGGSSDPYPAVVCSATEVPTSPNSRHIVLSGLGLDRVRSVALLDLGQSMSRARASSPATSEASDSLTITAQSGTFISVEAPAAVVPGQSVVLSDSGQRIAVAPVSTPMLSTSSATTAAMIPGGTIKPKDFAFIYAGGLFHLFYIRHDLSLPDSLTEKDFGHAVSTDLTNWTQLPTVIPADQYHWDNNHVWAPTIVDDHSGTYFMFYTGLSKTPGFSTEWGFPRIGRATSTDLSNWTRSTLPVLGGYDVPWAFADSTQTLGCQLRDPFVMPDPSNSGRWLMYYVTAPKASLTQRVVGVAQNSTGSTPWSDLLPMWNTDSLHYQGQDESPHVFAEPSTWYLFFTTNSGHPIQVQYSSSPLADSSAWAGTWSLYRVLGNTDPDINNWFASEHLTVAHHDYLAFVHGQDLAIEFREMSWGPPPSGGSMPVLSLGLPSVAGVNGGPSVELLSLSVLSSLANRAGAVLRLGLPARMRARLELFDLAGRRVRTLADGVMNEGASVLAWDGNGDGASSLSAGVFFARLTTPAGVRSAKELILR